GTRLAVNPARIDRYKPHAGTTMTLGLRPEHLTETHTNEKPGTAYLDATVDVTEPMGMETMVHFFIKGEPVCARVDPLTVAIPGQVLKLAADMSNMHLIDNTTNNVV
ncbi:MAG: TOBE domain-containing protein, partial [Alphaproteobacteria bacterium]|nr:TOBE domain-containing protein [Alphaproteobacteria bacterium]